MSSPKARILYVDDELNNLNGFKATFRRDYSITTAQSGKEAMEVLKDQEFEVIISDQRMPDMTGVQFFRSIVDDHPAPVRMLLTGYSDIEAVISAINDGQVYRYIAKPWEENDLRMTIDKAVQFYHTDSELKKRNQELEKAYSELEKFVYSASHDLRAPLASVLGIVRLAKMEDLGPVSDDYMTKIELSVNKLDLLLQNIIAYYRSARVEEEIVAIDFRKLIDETLESFAFYENAAKTRFTVEVAPYDNFKADESRLKIILNNLVSNAIKYQREEESDKQVNINVKFEDGVALIEVADNGVGIAPEEQEKVFTMFYRSATKSAGSGIGLYIVKDTLEKLSGSISLESTPGAGSKFTIKIPNRS